jgi:putative exporter of polyketide antibiotics
VAGTGILIAAPFAWVVLVATFLASKVGPLLNLPHRGTRSLPVHARGCGARRRGDGRALVGVLAAAAAFIAVGLWALRRRDLAGT